MSNKEINLNDIWQKKTIEPLPSKELLEKIGSIKSAHLKRTVLISVALSATSFFICWIWLYYNPQLITSKLGVILVILSMAVYGFNLNQHHPVLKKLGTANLSSNADCLNGLLELKRKQQFLQTFVLTAYFAMISLGVFLYSIEYLKQVSALKSITTCLIIAGWILFCWLYLRPRQIKKQQSKLNEIISKLENIQTQFDDY